LDGEDGRESSKKASDSESVGGESTEEG